MELQNERAGIALRASKEDVIKTMARG